MRRRGIWLLGALALLSGCAEIQYGEPKTVDTTLLRREHAVVRSSSRFTAGYEQIQNEIQISLTWNCDLVEQRHVRNTVHRKKENRMLLPELVLLGAGMIPAGIGAGVLADSPNVYDNNRNARLYNPSGQAGAIAGGIALVAWGVAMMSVPLVDVVRGFGVDESFTEADEQGDVIQPNVPCLGPSMPVSGMTILGRTQNDTFVLGTTGGGGSLRVDLAQVVPARIFNGQFQPNTIDIVANGRKLGEANVRGLLPFILLKQGMPLAATEDSDEKLWGISNRGACELKQDCSGVQRYLQMLPNGRHAAEARSLIEAFRKGPGLQMAAPTPEEKAKCKLECVNKCKTDANCVKTCMAEKCP